MISEVNRLICVAICVFSVRLLHVIAFSHQRNYFENATACSKRKLKTRVETQLYNSARAVILNLFGILGNLKYKLVASQILTYCNIIDWTSVGTAVLN